MRFGTAPLSNDRGTTPNNIQISLDNVTNTLRRAKATDVKLINDKFRSVELMLIYFHFSPSVIEKNYKLNMLSLISQHQSDC